jgi:hypothetical protein
MFEDVNWTHLVQDAVRLPALAEALTKVFDSY